VVTVENTLGYIGVSDVTAQGIITRQGVGILAVHDLVAPVLDSQLDVGHACAGNLDVNKILVAADLAYMSFWNVNSSNVTAFVEYGRLSVVSVPEFEGHFNTVSPYGFLDVTQGSLAGEVEYKTNTDAQVEGTIGAADAATGVLRDVSLTSVYGNVKFFVPNPHTKWWHEHHDGKEHH